MVDADADPGFVVRKIVHPVGNGLAELGVLKVVDADFERRSGGRIRGPPLRKSPTNSFFFVSTEITGWPWRCNAFTRRLMCSNCALRSG